MRVSLDRFSRINRFAFTNRSLRSVGFAGVAALCLLPALAHAQPRPGNGPATLHTVRVREYHVRHLKLFFNVNAADHSAKGIVTHYLTPLRSPLPVINMDARANLRIDQCRVDGKDAQFQHQQDVLTIIPPAGMAMGKEYAVEIRYTMPQTPTRGGANGAGGFRWIDPDPDRPDRRPGFWTQGETNTNSSWVPCYDYPNDKCTSETHTTVPAAWTVIGNGSEGPVTEDKAAHTRTYHWTMKQPHSTYLLSLAGGEMDVQKDEWRGVPLYYAVPKGKGNLIPGSYGNTPDMLSWFSDNLGVKYAWPKYAQVAVFDFPGGMENVSATTMGVFLTDKRAGNYPSSSLNSHELAHQWFGDLVTCKDWGDIWLNESFATFFEMFYTEHLDGAAAYEREVENNTQGYLRSAARAKRALSTNMYSDPDAMFESGHTYAKGGVILHMLRRELGDKLFFKGLGAYLEKFRYQPVETADLEGALSAYTKRDLKPFFDQWVRKPGHPVLDMTWTYDDDKKEVVATVKQMQNQGDGTPLYSTPLTLGLLPDPGTGPAGQKKDITQRHKVALLQDTQVFRIAAPTRPAVVLLDPDHDMLKEVRDNHWTMEQAGGHPALCAQQRGSSARGGDGGWKRHPGCGKNRPVCGRASNGNWRLRGRIPAAAAWQRTKRVPAPAVPRAGAVEIRRLPRRRSERVRQSARYRRGYATAAHGGPERYGRVWRGAGRDAGFGEAGREGQSGRVPASGRSVVRIRYAGVHKRRCIAGGPIGGERSHSAVGGNRYVASAHHTGEGRPRHRRARAGQCRRA